jgi:hypothetical protein
MVIPMQQENSGMLRGAVPRISLTLPSEHSESRLDDGSRRFLQNPV